MSEYFNTSYVVIKPVRPLQTKVGALYFNTSYVVIKPNLWYGAIQVFINFNTSYVVIKPYGFVWGCFIVLISIHLMLLLNN